MNTREKVAVKVTLHRLSLGLSQSELASRAGIDRKTVNRIENGHFMPRVETLVALGKVLGTSADELLGIGG